MFNPKRGIEASAGVLKDIILGNEVSDMSNNNRYEENILYFTNWICEFWVKSFLFSYNEFLGILKSEHDYIVVVVSTYNG